MNALNSLAAACTAFQTFAELVAAIEGGYLPTIYGTTRRRNILRRVLNASGFGVYPKFQG